MSSPSATNGNSSGDARHSSVPQPDQSLPKERRLRKRSEFQTVYEDGLRVPARFLTLFLRRTSLSVPGRFGLTVSRKVGNAVVRGRVKRLLRESIRLSWDLLPNGSEAVFHARPPIRDADFEALQSEVKRVLRTAAGRSGGEGES